jgi:hypothetical protein
MTTDKFDELARAVAAGAPRRQLITGLLGAAGGLFGLAGLRRGGDLAAAADTQKVYLPLIRTGTGICPIPSTCEEKQYCSDNRDCICVRTPEGGIRCGQIPSCSAQKCKTSADCANRPAARRSRRAPTIGFAAPPAAMPARCAPMGRAWA